jgi:hypothetical protein
MIKNGQVEIGKTPSEVSGKQSFKIEKGVALSYNEKHEDLIEKIACSMKCKCLDRAIAKREKKEDA